MASEVRARITVGVRRQHNSRYHTSQTKQWSGSRAFCQGSMAASPRAPDTLRPVVGRPFSSGLGPLPAQAKCRTIPHRCGVSGCSVAPRKRVEQGTRGPASHVCRAGYVPYPFAESDYYRASLQLVQVSDGVSPASLA